MTKNNNFDPESVVDEIQLSLQKINRKLQTVTTDDEVTGVLNSILLGDDLLPLTNAITDIDDRNVFGGRSASQVVSQMEGSVDTDRAEKLKRYKRLKDAQNHPEIAGALNIYADECNTQNADGETIQVFHQDQEVKEVVEACFERLGVYDKAWQILRNMCGYGDDYYELIPSKDKRRLVKMSWLPRESMNRVEKNSTLQGFTFDPSTVEEKNKSLSYYGANYKTDKEKNKELIYPFRILHFKIDSNKYGCYGEAVTDPVLLVIEQLQLLEKSLLIARLTRAVERRVFNVDVGNLTGDKAIKYAREAVNAGRTKRTLDMYGTDNLSQIRDIFGSSEDIIIPKRAGGDGNSIEVLPQLASGDNVADLEFIRSKLFPGLGIQQSYLYDDTFANTNTNLSSKSKQFANRIRRIQRFFIYQLYKIAIIELKLQGFPNRVINDLSIIMNNPSNIDEAEKTEMATARWNLIQAMKGLNTEAGIFIPDYIIYKDILKLSNEEIVEWLKLSELQKAGRNMFEAFPLDERPEGAEDLASGKEEETPEDENPEGGEEGVAPEGETQEMPAEVTDALGEPPEGEENTVNEPQEPENADVNFKNILSSKQKFLKAYTEMQQTSIKEITDDKEQEELENTFERLKKTKHVVLEEMSYSGLLGGLNQVIVKKKRLKK